MRTNKEYSQAVTQAKENLADLNDRGVDAVGEGFKKTVDLANLLYTKVSHTVLFIGKLVKWCYNKLKEKEITTYTIRQKVLIPQATLAKLKMCSGVAMEEIEQKLQEYKDTHNGKDFMCDVLTKTIEDICQLLQCQPEDLMEWKVDLKP